MGREEGRDKEKKIGEKLGSEEHSLYREEKDQALITTNTINVELTYIYEHSSHNTLLTQQHSFKSNHKRYLTLHLFQTRVNSLPSYSKEQKKRYYPIQKSFQS